MSESTQKILVTGGAGDIGSVLTKVLLDRGHRVTVLDNFLFDQTSLLDCCPSPSFSIVRGDCRDERVLREVIRQQDAIIPLAAIVGAPVCDSDRGAGGSTNPDAMALLGKLPAPPPRIPSPV